ncbi:hypothetical protein [Roseovarius salinarum]|uniref:hypothetical protein n=1 Tax=Roseovarius salinarum TaxID=1981892 RepID=UPI000C32A195|nr:hypothetical protein [Roseovarius salinarum]
MKQVSILEQREDTQVDLARLADLGRRLGQPDADAVVCRAMEELAQRIARTDAHCRAGALDQAAASARSMVAMAEQLGMVRLARVAADVARCARGGDRTALAATRARLLRVGERSLHEIWQAQDLSI